MFSKSLIAVCTVAVFIQSLSAQCLNSYRAFGPSLGCSCGPSTPVAVANTNAGSFTVTSSSPIAPSGVSLVSEYVIEGPLAVCGELPVLGAIGVDAQLPTGGQAATAYTCGTNEIGISSESLANAGISAAASGATGLLNAGVNSGFGGYGRLANGFGRVGCGCV